MKEKQYNIQCNFFSYISVTFTIDQHRYIASAEIYLFVSRSIPDAQLFLHPQLVPQSAHGLSQ